MAISAWAAGQGVSAGMMREIAALKASQLNSATRGAAQPSPHIP